MKKYWPFVVLALIVVIIAVVMNGSCGKMASQSSQSATGGSSSAEKSTIEGSATEQSDSDQVASDESIDERSAADRAAGKKRTPRVSTKLVKRWMLGLALRHPGMDARRGTTLREGAMGVKTTPTTLSWFEMADIDSNGTEEKVGFMWDGDAKVMFAYTLDPVRLDDGTVAKKGLVMAQYSEGNTAKRQQGSGFWAYATTRDTLSYRLVEGSLYGCRFDQLGRTTECGPGRWTRDNNNFAINTKVK